MAETLMRWKTEDGKEVILSDTEIIRRALSFVRMADESKDKLEKRKKKLKSANKFITILTTFLIVSVSVDVIYRIGFGYEWTDEKFLSFVIRALVLPVNLITMAVSNHFIKKFDKELDWLANASRDGKRFIQDVHKVRHRMEKT